MIVYIIYIAMNIRKCLIFSFCILLSFTACKNKKKDAGVYEYLRPATMNYTKQDTSNINFLVNRYTELVEKKDFEKAANMLYKVRNDSVVPLSDKERKGFIEAYSQMPIYAAKTDAFILRSDKNNQVDVLIQIVKNGNLDKGIGVSKMTLNPVVKKGKWYLTLMDKNAEGVIDVYDPNVNSY